MGVSACFANGHLYDYWDEEIRLFGVCDQKNNIDSAAQKWGHKKSPAFSYDLSDKVCGDFSISYKPSVSKHQARFGFMTQLWQNHFDLNIDDNISFHMKVSDDNASNEWTISLVDVKNRAASATLKGANTKGKWEAFTVPLRQLDRPEGFDLDSIKLVQFETDKFTLDAVIKFDKIAFTGQDRYFGITDKSIEQRMDEEQATKERRIDQAMRINARKAPFHLLRSFALFYPEPRPR